MHVKLKAAIKAIGSDGGELYFIFSLNCLLWVFSQANFFVDGLGEINTVDVLSSSFCLEKYTFRKTLLFHHK